MNTILHILLLRSQVPSWGVQMIGQSYITRHAWVRQESKSLQMYKVNILAPTAFPSIVGYVIVEIVSSHWVGSEVGSVDIGQHENGIGRRTARIPASGLFRRNCSWFLGEPYCPEMSNEFNENNNLTIQWYGTQPCISTWYLIPLIFLIFQFTFPVSYFHTTLRIQNRHG